LDTKSFPTVVEFKADVENYEAPRNVLESRLCEIWGQVLNVENVGIQDDFFSMGGSSIETIGLMTQLQSELNLTITIKDFYVHKTIKSLSENVIGKEQARKIENYLLNANQQEYQQHRKIPLLPNQKIFFQKQHRNLNNFVHTFAIHVPHELDACRLKECIHKLIDRHFALRLRFLKSTVTGKYIQVHDNSIGYDFNLNMLDINTLMDGEENIASIYFYYFYFKKS
jgi:acyl carrier protein